MLHIALGHSGKAGERQNFAACLLGLGKGDGCEKSAVGGLAMVGHRVMDIRTDASLGKPGTDLVAIAVTQPDHGQMADIGIMSQRFSEETSGRRRSA